MTDETPPGVYLVNATGDMTALATEDGGGDRQLLREALDNHVEDADVYRVDGTDNIDN